MRLENMNPTETEKLLFKYCGLYLIGSSDTSFRYAPVHIKENPVNFPCVIENIESEMIEYGSVITFDCISETIRFGNKYSKTEEYYDIDTMFLILQRMKELDFKQTFTRSESV